MKKWTFLWLVLASQIGCDSSPHSATPPISQPPPVARSPDDVQLLEGYVVGVSDGDTLTVRDDQKQTHRIRLADIDAPEQAQAFGTQAKQRLSEKVFNKDVTVQWREKDQYGRIAGHVFLDGSDINRELVAEGFAWHYKFHSKDRELAAAEQSARKQKLGLWRDKSPTPPWDFRRAHPREN